MLIKLLDTSINMATLGDELHMAVRANNVEKVEKLLEMGVDINCLFYGWTPLQLSIELGHKEITLLLLDKDNCDGCYHDNNNLSPFEMAVAKNQVVVVEKLLTLGVDGCKQLSNGEVPLFYAVEKGWPSMVKTLLDGNIEVNCTNGNGESPLNVACREECSNIVTSLLSAGADLNSICPVTGLTPLMIAVANENKETMKVLLKNNCDVNVQDKDGWTALWYAYSNRNEKLLQILLKSGADKSILNNDQKTVLDEAIENDEEEMIELLENCCS